MSTNSWTFYFVGICNFAGIRIAKFNNMEFLCGSSNAGVQDTNGSYIMNSSTVSVNGTPYVWTWTRSGNTLVVYLNGTQIHTGTLTTAGFTPVTDVLTQLFDGSIFQLMVFKDTTHNSSIVLSTSNYLRTIWGF